MKLTVDILGEAMMQNNEDAMEACRESGGALVMIDTLEMQKMLVLALNTTGKLVTVKVLFLALMYKVLNDTDYVCFGHGKTITVETPNYGLYWRKIIMSFM